jgi:phage/plasmid-like protein (TIGR03299 family)
MSRINNHDDDGTRTREMEMTGAAETIVHPPWHELGVDCKGKMSAEQMRKTSGNDYAVSKRHMAYASAKGQMIQIKGKFVLARDNDDAMLSIVGTVYKPVQTTQVFAFFHDFAKEAQLDIETCGTLSGGLYVWAIARIKGKDFDIGKKDEMRNYLLLLAPFEHGKALVAQWMNVRVASWSTFSEPLRILPNMRKLKMDTEEAKTIRALLVSRSDAFKANAIRLSAKKAGDVAVAEYFRRLLEPDRPGAKRDPIALVKYLAAWEKAPGSSLRSAKGTWWGALNAITYVVDHMQGKSRDTALKNAWLGNQAILKRRAMQLALEEAK